MMLKNSLKVLCVISFIVVLLSSCTIGEEAAPTINKELSDLHTATALTLMPGLPTETPASTSTPVPQPSPTVIIAEPSPATIIGEPSPTIVIYTGSTTGECYDLKILKSYTDHEKSGILAGQTFTMSWDLQNTGYCEWKPGYRVTFITGERNGGGQDILQEYVAPGEYHTFTIEMKAGKQPRHYYGTWALIGINGYQVGKSFISEIAVTGSNNSPTKTPKNH